MTDETIFATAREQADPAARAAYLTEACAGDPDRRRRVEGLLTAHEKAGEFLEKPLIPLADPDRMPTQDLGVPETDPSEPDDALTFLTPSTRPDSLGRLGHYEVLQVLGKGGFGIVFRAFDETLQRVVAIKVLSGQVAAASPARKRFLREARSSAKVRHEHIVQIYAVEDQPLPYLVMEFIPGETLQQRLDRTGPLETPEVVQFGRQIAEGLAAAHGMGLIHRDIKPGNILIEASANPCVKITDFGLARAADDASLTQSGTIAGTPMFMAPEQAHGDKLDHRADLFSLGSVLYTMCSGRPPFRANSTLAVLKRVAEDTPRPIPEIIPEVPQWLCDLITRLHAKKPEDRLGTAQEVADLLARGLAAMQQPAHVPSLPVIAPIAVQKGEAPAESVAIPKPAPALKPRPRTRRWAAAAAVFLLLGGLGFTEATGVTTVRGTIIRLFSPEGTLVVEVDDPAVSINIDGSDLVITGAGAREIRLKPGNYTVEGRKDGKVVSRELVSVTKNGRQSVRVSQEVVNSGGKGPGPKTVKETTGATAWERSVATLPAEQQVAAVAAKLKERNPDFKDPVRHKIEGGVVTEIGIGIGGKRNYVADISPVRALVGLKTLACINAPLSDLSPLKGMKLTALSLEDAPLLSDLLPLKDMPLKTLSIHGTGVTDLQPLQGMPLEHIRLTPKNITQGLDILRDMKSLKTIGWNWREDHGWPAAEFWARYDKGEFKEAKAAKPADAAAWARSVAAMPAAEQVKAVAARLKELNPGFDGKVEPTTKDGVVTGLQFLTLEVANIAPVRVLKGLTSLHCRGAWPKKGKLSTLSPLKGMPLTSLDIRDCGLVSDLSPLKGMPLTSLNLNGCKMVRDLEPLKGMKLTTLSVLGCPVQDLSPLQGMPLSGLDLYNNHKVSNLNPLQGMPLVYLNLMNGPVADLSALKKMTSLQYIYLSYTPVSDLTPLKGLKINRLSIQGTKVSDLSPLKGMPLKKLEIYGIGATDLRPLQGMDLEEIRLTPKNITHGLDILRDMKSLKTIGIAENEAWPAAEFWTRYDKGEFKK